MNKRKILSLALALSMLAILAIGGTLAYFTDTKSATNIFTVGSVEIKLHESQYSRHNMGVSADGMTASDEFSQKNGWDKPYWSNAVILADTDYEEQLQNEGFKNLVPGKQIDKNAYIENTGRNAAYVRMRILLPADLAVPNAAEYPLTATFMYTSSALGNGVSMEILENTKTINEIEYKQWEFTFDEALEPGDMTFWSPISKVYLPSSTTADDLPDGITGFNVIVEADAIQAEGFASAAAAFKAFDAQ